MREAGGPEGGKEMGLDGVSPATPHPASPLPALKATQTELLELRRKYDEEAASK